MSRFVLDLSDLARRSHNLKQSVSFLKNSKIKVSSEFKSARTGALEFKVFEEVSFHHCEIHCTAEKAEIFSDLGRLKELFEVIPHYGEKHLHFWLLTNQEDMSKGAYGADYKVNILLHDETVTLLPTSDKI